MRIWQILELGSAKSGFHGHSGRPGKRGGSASRNGRMPKDFSIDPASDAFIRRGDTNLRDRTLRGELKNKIVTEIAERSGEPYADVNEVVKQWSYSSNDNDYRSLSLQESIAEEFGVPLSAWQQERADVYRQPWNDPEIHGALVRTSSFRKGKEKPLGDGDSQAIDTLFSKTQGQPEPYEHVLGHRPDAREATKKILRSMYNYTQDELKAQNLAEVKLFRGVDRVAKHTGEELFTPGSAVKLQSNSSSSWASSTGEAARFGPVVSSIFPASRILGSARTGFGCLREEEWVVLGGQNDVGLADPRS